MTRKMTPDGTQVSDELATFASPPCFMHEVDPAYVGYLPTDETLALLNLLLEAEKAGARGVMRMARDTASARLCVELTAIARDEAGFCAMLTKHIRRLGGEPSTATGAFYDKLVARQGDAARMALLDRGQTWVALKLKEVLPRIGDEALHKDLTGMLDVHERNIRHCAELSGHTP
jgi:hypothetical protein